ncbi:MAG: transposase [Nocardioidaceae bacterium]
MGKHVANRLLADGEQVVDVPPKLSARTRVFATGQGRKTDATDAHSVALVGTRMAGLRPVVNDEQLAVLRILVDRRRSLGEDHTRMVSQLHQLLLELIPGGAKKDLSAAPGQGAAGEGPAPRRRRQDPPPGRCGTHQRPRADLCPQEGRRTRSSPSSSPPPAPALLTCNGIGPSGAARLLVEVGDITRFPNKAHFASWNGTAPIDASSGDQVRHRLSRGGNRQINRVLHIMARVQIRNPSRGPRLLRPQEGRRQSPDGSDALRQTPALRHRLPADAQRRHAALSEHSGTGPGGHRGTTLTPARPAHIPTPALRTSHFPDPPRPSLEPALPAAS